MKTYSGSIQHILWTTETDLVVVADIIGSGQTLLTFRIGFSEKLHLIEQLRIKLTIPVLNIAYNKKFKRLAVQSQTGLVLKYDENFTVLDEFQFPQACPKFQYFTTNDLEAYVGCTQYYRLYVNKVEVANNCNSFYVHDEYLLFTDHANTLKFVDLGKISKCFH